MPQIPRYRHTEDYPSAHISPEIATAPFKGMAELGEGILEVAERDRRAEITKQALKTTNAIRDSQDKFAESLYERTDYHNFVGYVDEWEKETREIHEKSSKLSDGSESRTLAASIDQAISNRAIELKRLARDKARQMMVDETKGEWEKSKVFYAKDYALEKDPAKKTAIKDKMAEEARELANRGILWSKEAETDIIQFNTLADSIGLELDKAEADKAIRENPKQALINLHDPEYLPNLKATTRQNKIDKAEAALKVLIAEQEKALKDIKKEKHDLEDKEIAKLFMKKQFSAAYNMALSSEALSGDEMRGWATAIESASKRGEDEVDPVVEASNYAMVNELISKEADPATIRKYIMSYEFKTATRQKLIDRLDTETDRMLNKAKSRAYDYMKSQIMPYGGMLAEVPPLQAANYTKAMNALDDYVDKARKGDKILTPHDIQRHAEELAITFQTSVAERQEYTAREMREYFEQLKGVKEKKKPEPSKSEEPVGKPPSKEKWTVGKVYEDAQGKKAKYLGDGKWQPVK